MKNNILRAKWSKREKDIEIFYPRKCDGALLFSWITNKVFDKTILQHLEERGYDITTFKFTIERKDEENNQ